MKNLILTVLTICILVGCGPAMDELRNQNKLQVNTVHVDTTNIDTCVCPCCQ